MLNFIVASGRTIDAEVHVYVSVIQNTGWIFQPMKG